MSIADGLGRLTAMEQAYAAAQRLLPWHSAARAVRNVTVLPFWSGDSLLSFRHETPSGWEFLSWVEGQARLVRAFDHERLARGLAAALGSSIDADRLPFHCFERHGDEIRFNVSDRSFAADGREQVRAVPAQRVANGIRSPDGKRLASIVDGDVHVRAEGEIEWRVTRDAEPLCAYGAWPEANLFELSRRSGALRLTPPIGWSPDSRFFAVHRLDQTAVGALQLLDHSAGGPGGRPLVHSYRYALPADAERPWSTLFVVDTRERTIVPLEIPALQSVVLPPIPGLGYWWSDDSRVVFVLRWSTGRRRLDLYAADPRSGAARLVLTEEADRGWIRSTHNYQASPNVRYLPGSRELLWCSERSGWSHLYLYDLDASQPKSAVTSGNWLVDTVLHVDESSRMVYFSARGREPDRDPYERYIYRAPLDGSEITLLTPEAGDHFVHTPTPPTMFALGSNEVVLVTQGFSPSGDRFVESHSSLNLPTVTRVRRANDGAAITDLAEADVAELRSSGWKAPQRVRLRGRDDRTAIWATLWSPLDLDPAARYPLVDIIYPGPHVNLAPTAFTVPGAKSYFWPEALAALGFAVLMLDGLGTPYRERDLANFSWRNLGDAGLPDHVAAFPQLRARFPWLDTDRIGIVGTSAGGYAAARAMLQFPEVFKVGVAGCGAHDVRLIHAAWAEILLGVTPEDAAAAEQLYAETSNYDLAPRLRGKLLLVHGDIDENVHPAITLRLVDRLIRADRDFDLLLLPGRGHDFRHDPYFARRTFDYLVRHLLKREPPAPSASLETPATPKRTT